MSLEQLIDEVMLSGEFDHMNLFIVGDRGSYASLGRRGTPGYQVDQVTDPEALPSARLTALLRAQITGAGRRPTRKTLKDMGDLL